MPRPDPKLRYLELAATLARTDMSHEPAFAHIVSHVKLSMVATQLGVSRSSLYRMWPTQIDFWRDLVVFISIRDDRPWMHDELDAHDQPLHPADDEALLERIRKEFSRAQDRLIDDPRLVLRAALLGYPPVRQITERRAAWEAAQRRAAAARLASTLGAAGRAPVDPLTHIDLATAIWLMADGIALAARVDRSFGEASLDLDGDPARPWPLLPYVVRSIVMELTHPVGESASAVATASSGSASSADTTARLGEAAAWDAGQLAALQAGADLFARSLETPHAPDGTAFSVEALGQVTLARVARAAGVTRRQLYHLWESQEEFRIDLIRHVRTQEGAAYYRSFDEGIDQVMAAPRLSHVALDICEHVNRWRLEADRDRPDDIGFALQPHMRDPDVRAGTLRWMGRLRSFQQQRIDAFIELLGVRLRAGVEAHHVNALLMAAAGGSERLHRVDPGAMRADVAFRGGSYTIFSIACQAFIDHSVDPHD